MMPCTRLYVYPKIFLMVQVREKRLLGLLKQQRENMRGNSSLFIIITPKDNTQAFKKLENKHLKRQETGYKGHLLSLYVIIEVSPTPPCTCLINPTPPDIQPLPSPSSFHPPPLVGVGPTIMTIVFIAHPTPPPPLPVYRQGGQ